MPAHWRRSVTFDNGTEFAHHYRLHALGIETFFCDTHSPWQKGGVENAIGRLRRNLPRKTDLATLSPCRFAQLVQAYNNTPRKCLDYLTPAEVFHNQLLHFKCESIFRPAPERRLCQSRWRAGGWRERRLALGRYVQGTTGVVQQDFGNHLLAHIQALEIVQPAVGLDERVIGSEHYLILQAGVGFAD